MIGSRYEKKKVLSFDERVDPTSTALVVIDVQNDFALPQGVCGQVGDDISLVAPMVARLKALIESARKAGVLIVFVRTIYDEPVLSPALAEQYSRRGYPNSICLTGTRGAEFYHGIGPKKNAPNEILVTKHRYSAFWGSSIDLVLRNNGIRTVVLTGIATEVCVESTARDAFFKDYQVVVPEDCVGCYSEDRQQAALVVIARSFGVVTSGTEIATVWQKLGNGARNWQPEMRAQRALTTLDERLRPAHTALVLANIQSDIYGADQDRDNVAMISTLPATKALLDNARYASCFIIHARAATLSERGVESAPFVAGFEPRGEEQVVTCHRFSAFADTQLDVLLRSNCIRTAVFAGATTNCTIETTVRETADRDYYAIVAVDCVAAPDTEADLHAAALTNIGRYFGTVLSSDAIAATWAHDASLHRETYAVPSTP
jgi:ureidoacrylate peracid hydrolase